MLLFYYYIVNSVIMNYFVFNNCGVISDIATTILTFMFLSDNTREGSVPGRSSQAG